MKLHELFIAKESVNYNGAFWLSQVQGSDSPVSPVGAVPKAQQKQNKKIKSKSKAQQNK